jgi:hypothetical protein
MGIYSITEDKLKAAERTDFGLPAKKKYPMPDEGHVKQAIRMFNHCDPEDEAELARNIKKYMKKYNMDDVEVSEKNRFSKYYHPKKNIKEETDMSYQSICESTESFTDIPWPTNMEEYEEYDNRFFVEYGEHPYLNKEPDDNGAIIVDEEEEQSFNESLEGTHDDFYAALEQYNSARIELGMRPIDWDDEEDYEEE